MFSVKFNGYASRSEYWKLWICWTLILSVVAVITIGRILFGMISGAMNLQFDPGMLKQLIIMYLVLIPISIYVGLILIGVTVRRCRDIGISPFWTLATLVPYINCVSVLIIGILDTNSESSARNTQARVVEPEQIQNTNQPVATSNNTKYILIAIVAFFALAVTTIWFLNKKDDVQNRANLNSSSNSVARSNEQAKLADVQTNTQNSNIQTLYYSHGKYEGEVFNGKADGRGTYTANKTGAIYSGQFVNDTFNGQGTMSWTNGDKYTGVWQNDSGINGTMTYANGQTAVGQVRNGIFIPMR